MDFLKNAVENSFGFLGTVFSFNFWKEAAFAAVLTGFTKAVKSFIETSTNVAIGIIRSLFAKKFRRHKYDATDEFEDDMGLPDGFEDDDFDDDYDPEDVKVRNLQALKAEHASKKTSTGGIHPSEAIDDIPDDKPPLNQYFDGPEDDDLDDFDDTIDVAPNRPSNNPKFAGKEWQGSFSVMGEAGCV